MRCSTPKVAVCITYSPTHYSGGVTPLPAGSTSEAIWLACFRCVFCRALPFRIRDSSPSRRVKRPIGMYNTPKDVSGCIHRGDIANPELISNKKSPLLKCSRKLRTDRQPTQQINPPQKWRFACVAQATVQMLNVKTQTHTVQTFKTSTSSVKPVKRPDRKLVQAQVGAH